MRYSILIIFFLLPLLASTQTILPDTLVLKTKSGDQLILISTNMNRFKTVKADSMIRLALYRMRDSLAKDPEPHVKNADTALKTPVMRPVSLKAAKKPLFVLQPVIGAALIKDKVSPFAGLALDFAPQRKDYDTKRWPGMYTYLNLAAHAYYLFEHTESKTVTNTVVFIDASIGNRMNNSKVRQSRFDEYGFGIGYLIRNEGDYFQKNTFRLSGNLIAANSIIKVSPELYLTDNFKHVFPGISIGIRLLH